MWVFYVLVAPIVLGVPCQAWHEDFIEIARMAGESHIVLKFTSSLYYYCPLRSFAYVKCISNRILQRRAIPTSLYVIIYHWESLSYGNLIYLVSIDVLVWNEKTILFFFSRKEISSG